MKSVFQRISPWLFFAGLLLGVMPSCDYSYFEMDQVPDYIYQPVFALPLVHSTLTISDMIPEDDDDLVVVGEDNLISLVYSDHLISAYGGEIFQLPDAGYTASFSAAPSGKSSQETITRVFRYETGYNDQLDSITFMGGTLAVEVSAAGLNADGFQASIVLSIPDSYNAEGQPFSMILEANSEGQQSLDGYTFLFYSSGSDQNLFDVHYEVAFSGSGNPVNAPYTFQLNQSFQGMQMEKMVGAFAPRNLFLGGMGVNIGLFDRDTEGEISFSDPKVRLKAFNSFGLDLEVQVNELVLRNDSENSPLSGFPNPWTIQGPGINQVGESAYSEWILGKDNSNVVAGVAIQPHTLYSSLNAQLNPGQGTAFVLDQSQLDVLVELELPLNGSATGFSLKDTLELSRNDSIKEVEWIELAVDVFNGLPAGLFLQVEFADSVGQINGILFEDVEDFQLIESAQVDEQGQVIAPERTQTLIMLNEAQTQAFLNSDLFIISARLSTANQGQDNVRIYDTQTLEVRLGARIKGKVTVEF